ncbi:hypothetical protein BDZ89DRAFT_920178, partial [Hymenopellis radicata]
FSIGTPKKPYCTITTDSTRFNPALEPSDATYVLPPGDEIKFTCDEGAKYAPARYLMNTLKRGEVCIAKRGKLFAIAVGHHCMVVHWGLEALLMELRRELYNQIILPGSVPGSNKDRSKAEKLRRFLLPPELAEYGSKEPEKDRYVSIMAAIVCPTVVWVVVHWSRLVRMHVISRDTPWTQDDLKPGSSEWDNLWKCFNGGPDWQSEACLVDTLLRTTWRSSVLAKASLRKLPIIDLLTSKNQAEFYFAPFGRHLAHDALFFVGVLPTTPAHHLISEDTVFNEFILTLQTFMDRYHTPEFVHDC